MFKVIENELYFRKHDQYLYVNLSVGPSWVESLFTCVWHSSILTAVQLVFNPFGQLVPQLELYSQLQLSLWSDPIAFSVPKPT